MKQKTPDVRIHNARRQGDFALLHLELFAPNDAASFCRISSNARGIAQSVYGSYGDRPAQEHFPFIRVNISLPSARGVLHSESIELFLSVHLKNSQERVTLFLHEKDRNFFTARYKLREIIIDPPVFS